MSGCHVLRRRQCQVVVELVIISMHTHTHTHTVHTSIQPTNGTRVVLVLALKCRLIAWARLGSWEAGGVCAVGVAQSEISARKIYVKFIKRNKRRQLKTGCSSSQKWGCSAGATHTHTHTSTRNHLDKALHS